MRHQHRGEDADGAWRIRSTWAKTDRERSLLNAFDDLVTRELTRVAGVRFVSGYMELRPDMSYAVHFELQGWGPAFHRDSLKCSFKLGSAIVRHRMLGAGSGRDEANQAAAWYNHRGNHYDDAQPLDPHEAAMAILGCCDGLLSRQRLTSAAAARRGIPEPVTCRHPSNGGLEYIPMRDVWAPTALVEVLLQSTGGDARMLASRMQDAWSQQDPHITREYDHDNPDGCGGWARDEYETRVGLVTIQSDDDGEPIIKHHFDDGTLDMSFDGYVLRLPCDVQPETVLAAMRGRRVAEITSTRMNGVGDCLVEEAVLKDAGQVTGRPGQLILRVSSPRIRLGDHPALGRHLKPGPSLLSRIRSYLGGAPA